MIESADERRGQLESVRTPSSVGTLRSENSKHYFGKNVKKGTGYREGDTNMEVGTGVATGGGSILHESVR